MLDDPKPGIRLLALSLPEAAMILTQSGEHPITEAMLRDDIAAGAPLNPDGTLNLIAYTAWVVKGLADAR